MNYYSYLLFTCHLSEKEYLHNLIPLVILELYLAGEDDLHYFSMCNKVVLFDVEGDTI